MRHAAKDKQDFSYAAFIWTGEYVVSHFTISELHSIDFTTPPVNWRFSKQFNIHHLWKRIGGKWTKVARQGCIINWQKYVCNETIVHVVWCNLYYYIIVYRDLSSERSQFTWWCSPAVSGKSTIFIFPQPWSWDGSADHPIRKDYLLFYALATSKVKSWRVLTCDSAPLWWLYSAAPLGDQVTSNMTWYSKLSHYPDIQPTSPSSIPITLITWLWGSKCQFYKSLVSLDPQ